MLEIHDYLPGRVQSVGMQDIVFHVDRQVAVCGVEVGTSVVGEGKSGWKGWRGGVWVEYLGGVVVLVGSLFQSFVKSGMC